MAYNVQAYADMHVFNGSISIVIGASNTWVAVPSGLISSDHKGFTLSGGNTQTCNDAGIYAFSLSVTLSCSSANQSISATYAINGTASPNVVGQAELVNAGKTYCVSCSDINVLNSGDAVTIVLQNNTAAHNLTAIAVSLTLVKVG